MCQEHRRQEADLIYWQYHWLLDLLASHILLHWYSDTGHKLEISGPEYTEGPVALNVQVKLVNYPISRADPYSPCIRIFYIEKIEPSPFTSNFKSVPLCFFLVNSVDLTPPLLFERVKGLVLSIPKHQLHWMFTSNLWIMRCQGLTAIHSLFSLSSQSTVYVLWKTRFQSHAQIAKKILLIPIAPTLPGLIRFHKPPNYMLPIVPEIFLLESRSEYSQQRRRTFRSANIPM